MVRILRAVKRIGISQVDDYKDEYLKLMSMYAILLAQSVEDPIVSDVEYEYDEDDDDDNAVDHDANATNGHSASAAAAAAVAAAEYGGAGDRQVGSAINEVHENLMKTHQSTALLWHQPK